MITVIAGSIHPDLQRYDTVGDYFLTPDRKALLVNVSNQKHWQYEWLIMIHELIEAGLVLDRGIKIEDIDNWDLKSKADEPGDEHGCPYRFEHKFATRIEKLLCKEFGITWNKYNRAVMKVGKV